MSNSYGGFLQISHQVWDWMLGCPNKYTIFSANESSNPTCGRVHASWADGLENEKFGK
jgi:hypothetical protein